jgi:hypothetical protein
VKQLFTRWQAVAKAIAALLAALTVLVAMAPPAQAVGSYKREIMNYFFDLCMSAESAGPTSYINLDSCRKTARTNWTVHVKSDSYQGTGHEVWQIESRYLPGHCLVGGGSNALVTLGSAGSCQYSGDIHNKFEVFKSSWGYQLKDIEAWENNGQHLCIYAHDLSRAVLMDSCEGAAEEHWKALSD